MGLAFVGYHAFRRYVRLCYGMFETMTIAKSPLSGTTNTCFWKEDKEYVIVFHHFSSKIGVK